MSNLNFDYSSWFEDTCGNTDIEISKPQIKLNFSHPYGEYLYTFGVPSEKHDEFYERFGYYLYSLTTPKDEKEAAFRWMLMNRKITKLTGQDDQAKSPAKAE